MFLSHIRSIISEIVQQSMDGNVKEEDKVINNDDLLSYVFQNILNQEDLDIRDKKSAIIDFIAAGIETVNIFFIFKSLFLLLIIF